ncbi:uncharacterized protein LOC124328949 isoform X2 [Daphnia pulicaria]|uniref:uncharacterized protein LOC124328949 isoform X2 n=1 Tax=Daphnia pulicaria TaxID=35523 RepID=UPI001EEA9716|nr:uncharacterized protein LOC124328949 isoform X2 [Daphnia pulicaria]
MLYKSVCVNIYDSQTTSNNKKIYFFSPIALLNNLDVASIHNLTVPQVSVGFSIWNQEVRKEVTEHLNQLLSEQIEPSHVKVLPFNSVRLTSKVRSADFSLTNEWLPYGNQPLLRFSLICPTREDCNRVKSEMEINPKQFEHLKLDFKPQLKDGTMFIGIAPKDFSTQVEELKRKIEETNLNFNKELKKFSYASDDVAEKFYNMLQETKQELLGNIENKFAKELDAIREGYLENLRKSEEASQVALDILKKELHVTKKDFAATSQMLADKIKVTEENLAAALQNLEITRNELTETNGIVEKLSAKLNATISDLETATTKLASATRTELNSTKSAIADLTRKLNAQPSEIVDIGQMPTSCADLLRTGHKLSGFFLVKGLKKMEMVYCKFYPNGNDFQKWIGYADVKSATVHFYAQRIKSYSTESTPIPFDFARTNEGNAMDLTSGIFTAPRPGIYFFSFTGLANFPYSSSVVYFGVGLYLNGVRIGLGYVEEANTAAGQSSPLTLQSTQNLKKGDRVWVQIYFLSVGVKLLDSSNHYTHFTGFMLEEEIVASF